MQHLQNANDTAVSAEQCADELIEVVPAVMRTIRRLMRAEGASELSVPQFRALGFVRRHPHTSLSAVAEHLGLSVPAASRLIDALVARRLVKRRTAESDRRYVGLELSPAGAALVARAHAYTARELAALLAALAEPERAAIVGALAPLRAIFATAPARAETTGPNNATEQTERSL